MGLTRASFHRDKTDPTLMVTSYNNKLQ